MKGYLIAESQVLDEALYDQYRTLAAASIAKFGGTYLARGAVATVVEGEAANGALAIVEFPSMQRLREWYASQDYAAALKLAATAVRRRLIFIEGLPPV